MKFDARKSVDLVHSFGSRACCIGHYTHTCVLQHFVLCVCATLLEVVAADCVAVVLAAPLCAQVLHR